MITNELQYRITQSELKKFEKTLAALLEEQKQLPSDVHPKLQQAYIDAAQSEIEILRAQMAEYDELRAGRVEVLVAVPELAVIEEVPRALIRARIASGMTQAQLAAALHLKTQQVQKYEASNYAGASLSRVREVAQILLGAKSERLKAA